jgi:hypothetical protein
MPPSTVPTTGRDTAGSAPRETQWKNKKLKDSLETMMKRRRQNTQTQKTQEFKAKAMKRNQKWRMIQCGDTDVTIWGGELDDMMSK